MTPEVRGTTGGALGNPSVPGATQIGDLLIAFACHSSTGDITASGYNHASGSPITGRVYHGSVLYRIATGSDTCTLTGASGPRSAMIAISKDTYDSLSIFGGNAAAADDGTTTGHLPSITTQKTGSLIIHYHSNSRDGTDSTTFWASWTTPSSETFTEFADFISSSGSGTGLGVGYYIRDAIGTTGTQTVSNGANGGDYGYVLEIRGSDPPVTDTRVTIPQQIAVPGGMGW